MATAGVAALGVLGSAFQAGTPANGSSLENVGPITLTADSVVQQAITPLTKLTAGPVARGHYLDLTATAKSVSGRPLFNRDVHLQRFDNGQWVTVGRTHLTAKGTAKFHFKIWNDHQFRVDLGATTTAAPVTDEAFSAPVSVRPMSMEAFGAAVVADAATHKGAKYVFATAGPKTFDCSGLVKYVFAKYGIDLPHYADDMKHYGKRISRKDARPGDLVFVFTGNYAHHVAIYAGNGTWWEAPHTGSYVRHVKIWSKHIEFRRLNPDTV
jgi:cell wall-associated NlpC family hydrolase